MAHKIDTTIIQRIPKGIFADQPTVNVKDLIRLHPNISNQNTLNELLVLGNISETDVKKMLLIEAAGLNRDPIIRRLLQKLSTIGKLTIREKICSKKK